MINVLLVDDHELISTGIKALLERADDIRVIGISASGEEAILAVEKERPDVILMDVNMPGIGGAEASRRILKSHPEIKIIGLSQHNNNSIPKQLLDIGAMGFVSKSSSSEEMMEAIHKVMQGKVYLCNDVAEQLVSKAKDSVNPFSMLSARESEVVSLIFQGKSIPEMAIILGLKDKTINTFRYRMYKKLKVKNDVELIKLIDKFNTTF